MFKKNRLSGYLILISVAIILCLFIWLFMVIFEGERPIVSLDPRPEFLSKKQLFTINACDLKRGLKELKVVYNQGGTDVTLFEQKFPFQGIFNREGVRDFKKELDIDPSGLQLAQGRVDLEVRVWDYSRRNGGDGNMAVVRHTMTVDTIPPAIRAISSMHNINIGGAGLVVYRASSDTIESGVYVDDLFFRGFPAGRQSKEGTYLAYFALPYNSGSDPSIRLSARDRAENTASANFYYHINLKRFGDENMDVTDAFLRSVLPFFSDYKFDPDDSDIEKYIKINNDLRKKDDEAISKLAENTAQESYWEGAWVTLKNAATRAGYADHRTYYYRGQKIDEQYHLGIDLASLANSPVEAGNGGKIIFAGKNGIYGLMVVIDHGQGIASLYGHLSGMEVAVGDMVKKGDIIGYTGQTGLAGGDHLHFSMLVHGIFVNPMEWIDEHWIEDNITKKLDLIKQQQ
jgi:murein DD-endopeptidase MepM/ murein hydrolase activator NlpD